MSNQPENVLLPDLAIRLISDSSQQSEQLASAIKKDVLLKEFLLIQPTKSDLAQKNAGVPENEMTVIVSLLSHKESLSFKKSENVFLISSCDDPNADLYIASNFSESKIITGIKTGVDYLSNKRQLSILATDISAVSKEREELSKIGIAMSAEKDLDKLLTMVLEEGRKFGNCEGASLYLLVNENTFEPELLFKLTQNSEINFDFKENHFPLTNQSLAGYVALTGEILNIPDAYQLPYGSPYKFDKSFDVATNYRTRQLLVLPMRNHKGKIIGVLQFINNRAYDDSKASPVGFNRERQELLLSLASQAAVAIDNNQLIDNIQSLFEGFVSASVKAIESRDPVTSGHSFRVAELTSGLAKTLDSHQAGKYRALTFSKAQLREIRYASLLHDFGKVGVKENVLLKPNKLHQDRLSFLELKLEWQKQLIQRKFYQTLVSNKNIDDLETWRSSDAFEHMNQQIKKLDEFHHILNQANRPSLLEEEIAEELNHLFNYQMDESYPFGQSLLSQEDFLSLSVKKGSLTQEERNEIQSHVVHTEEFLREIPWTDELSFVPKIAASHHEKLDGTGYPLGIRDNDIPIPSKIMAIADIYDALTARDRPYKKAVSIELALDILKQEADHGKLCKVMVNTFIESKVYQNAKLK